MKGKVKGKAARQDWRSKGVANPLLHGRTVVVAANGLVQAALVEHGYSVTWSARSSTDCGIVKPSALAVLRLMTSSKRLGCSMGRSPGLAPFKTLSTYCAARRNVSDRLGA